MENNKMSNEITVQNNTDLITFDSEKVALIKRIIAPTATADEMELFLHQCRRTGLDPLAKQIYFQKFNGKMAIVTGIDGYRLIASRTNVYAGSNEPSFDGRISINDRENWDKITHAPAKVTQTVRRFVQGIECEFSATVYWEEFYPGGKRGGQWRKMPHVMLAKVAEAAALRKAFPADLSGIYTSDEMDQAAITHTAPIRPSNVMPSGEIVESSVTVGVGEFEDKFKDELPEEQPTIVHDGNPASANTSPPPADVGLLMSSLQEKAGTGDNPASEKQVKLMMQTLGDLCDSEKMKRSVMMFLFNMKSGNDATSGQASAIIEWGGLPDNNWKAMPESISQAHAIYKAALIHEGQLEMFKTESATADVGDGDNH